MLAVLSFVDQSVYAQPDGHRYHIIDPADEHPAKAVVLNEGDWTPWEDRVLPGWPACTVKGGRVVVEGNVMVDDSMGGSLLRRTLDPSVHAGAALD